MTTIPSIETLIATHEERHPAKAPAIEITTATSVRFEKVTCGRCAGSGQYPSAAWQGVCLGCQGTGVVYTRNGAAARKRWDAFLAERCTRRSDEVQAGDLIQRPGGKWVKVHESHAIEGRSGGTYTVGSGESAVTTKIVHDWELITRRFDGTDVHNITSRDSSWTIKPTGDLYVEGVRRIAKLKGVTLT